jgi:hypothetical protein
MLRQFLDDHPIPTVLGVVISVSTVSIGVSEYFARQRMDNAAAANAALIETKNDEIRTLRSEHTISDALLKEQIDILNRKFLSVERVITKDDSTERLVFDLSTVVFDKSDLGKFRHSLTWYSELDVGLSNKLDSDFTLSSSNDLVVELLSIPDSFDTDTQLDADGETDFSFDDWLSDKMETVSSTINTSDSAMARMAAAALQQEVTLWHGTDLIRTTIYMKGEPSFNMALTPFIALSIIDNSYYEKKVQALLPSAKAIGESLMGDLADESDQDEQLSEEAERSFVSAFSNVQLPALILAQYINERTFARAGYMSYLSEWKFIIRSFQKTERLTYLSVQQRLVNGMKLNNGDFEDLLLDEELFIISRQNDVVVIRTFVPSVGDSQSSYVTVQSWFDALKIATD